MFKGRISRVFDLEAEERGSSANALESSDQLCVPTLDERAKLYLRAVHGKRDFATQEYSDARNLILDAMAADFAAKSEIRLPDESREAPKSRDGIRIPEAAVIVASARWAGLSDVAQRFQVASPSGLAEPDKRPSVTPPAWLAKRSISIYAGVIAASVMALVLVRLLPMVWFAPDSKLQTALSESSSPDRRSKGDFAGKGMVPRAEVGEPDAGHVQAQTAPALEPTPRPPARSRTATAVRQEPQSDREAIADLPDLLKHGQALIAADKISEARQVLKTAAEAGSAPAALALGGTYDPTMQQQNPTMQQRKALPLQPTASTVPGGSLVANKADITDITIARAWYEKARDLGSTEAAVRLERLAGRDGQLPRRAPPTVPKTDLPPQH